MLHIWEPRPVKVFPRPFFVARLYVRRQASSHFVYTGQTASNLEYDLGNTLAKSQ